MSLPAFASGVPGGMEFVIILVVSLFLLAAIVSGVVAVARAASEDRGDGDLEARVENLEGQVAACARNSRGETHRSTGVFRVATPTLRYGVGLIERTR